MKSTYEHFQTILSAPAVSVLFGRMPGENFQLPFGNLSLRIMVTPHSWVTLFTGSDFVMCLVALLLSPTNREPGTNNLLLIAIILIFYCLSGAG